MTARTRFSSAISKSGARVSVRDEVRAKRLDKSARNVKVLTIDVERFPMRALSYERWQTTIPTDWIMERSRISCFAAKWLHEKKTTVIDERDGHREMTLAMWDMLSEADIVVTYNGEKADLPWMRNEFKFHGLGLPAPYKSVDLIKTNRKQFNLESRSLQYFGEFLGKGGKLDSGGAPLVRRLLEGTGTERDWKQYRTYNRRDTELTENIYLDLIGYIVDQPHIGLLSADENQRRCAHCGSAQLDLWRKPTYAYVRMYELYRCSACLGWNKSTSLIGSNQFTRMTK